MWCWCGVGVSEKFVFVGISKERNISEEGVRRWQEEVETIIADQYKMMQKASNCER